MTRLKVAEKDHIQAVETSQYEEVLVYQRSLENRIETLEGG